VTDREHEQPEVAAAKSVSPEAGHGADLWARHSVGPIDARSQVARYLAAHPGATLSLQRKVGNRAVAAALMRQPVAAPPSAAEIAAKNTELNRQVTAAPPDWDGAADTLNWFSDADMKALLQAMSYESRVGLFIGAMRRHLLLPPPVRVADAVYAVDGAAAREGRIKYVKEATGRSEWPRVALAMNGFSDDDIVYVADKELPAANLSNIRGAALTIMPGWSDRVVHGLNRIIVANQMAGSVGSQQGVWHPSGPSATATDFSAWAMAASEDKSFTVSATSVLNCWEMVLYAAWKSGSLAWSWIHSIYSYVGPDWSNEFVRRTGKGSKTWNPSTKTPKPKKGDVVYFNGTAHVTLATGVTDAAGNTHVDSFWPAPDVAFKLPMPQHGAGHGVAAGTPDKVKDTTIEALKAWMEDPANGGTPGSITVTIADPGGW
jgi:hypothetical protein